MQFGIVSLEMLPSAWDKCLPLISRACNHNGNIDSPEDIYQDIADSRKYLWLAIKDLEIIGLVLTSLEVYPLKKVCSIDICTGSILDEWIGNLPIIEQWGKDNGCSKMFFMCREGYGRKLKDFNYKKTHIFLEKDLS